MSFSSPAYSSFIPIYPHACMITFHARFLSLHPQCPLPISSHPSRTHSTLHTPLMHSHYSFPPNPFFSHSCMATHGHVMPISPYANLHTRILHALMYITTLSCITILHLPIFLLLTTFLSLHHIPFMHCFLSLHHHHYQPSFSH